MAKELTGYELSRDWFDFCFENTDLISPGHSALYFFAIEHCNRLGWKRKFGLPSMMTREAIGIKNHRSYIKIFNDLVLWGFFELIQQSKNQHSSTIVALVKNTKATTKALDKATLRLLQKQSKSTALSTAHIDKPVTNKPVTIELQSASAPKQSKINFKERYFKIPTKTEVFEKMKTIGMPCPEIQSEKFWDYYNSKGWKVGKVKMVSWQSAVNNWLKNHKEFQNEQSKPNAKPSQPSVGRISESEHVDFNKRRSIKVAGEDQQ